MRGTMDSIRSVARNYAASRRHPLPPPCPLFLTRASYTGRGVPTSTLTAAPSAAVRGAAGRPAAVATTPAVYRVARCRRRHRGTHRKTARRRRARARRHHHCRGAPLCHGVSGHRRGARAPGTPQTISPKAGQGLGCPPSQRPPGGAAEATVARQHRRHLQRKRTSTRRPRSCILLLLFTVPRPQHGRRGLVQVEPAVRAPAHPFPRAWGVVAPHRAHRCGRRAGGWRRGPRWLRGGPASPPFAHRKRSTPPWLGHGARRDARRAQPYPLPFHSRPRQRATAHSLQDIYGASTRRSRRNSNGDCESGWGARRRDGVSVTVWRPRSHGPLPAPAVPLLGYTALVMADVPLPSSLGPYPVEVGRAGRRPL